MKGIHKISQNLLTNLSVRMGQPYAPNKPIYIFLEVTNRCNLACIMCGRTHDPRYEMAGHCGDLTLQRVKRLDSFYPYATFTIPTGVGEPFINRELLPILKYLKSKGTQVSLTSNGTILNKIQAVEIIKCGLDKIVFSIDGATKHTFEKFRVHARFDHVINNIRRLQQLKKEMGSPYPVVEFELVAMADNFPELPMWAEMAGDLGIQGLIVQNLFEHSGEPHGHIYRGQSLRNIPYSRGVKIWDEFIKTSQRRKLYVNSPFLTWDFSRTFGPDTPSSYQRPLGVVILGSEDLARLQLTEAVGRDANGNGNGNGNGSRNVNGNGNGNQVSMEGGHCDGNGNGNGRAHTPSNGENGNGKAVESQLVQIQSAPASTPGEELRPMYCDQPWSVIYMAWNGDIRTCCFNDHALGNIDRHTIDEIWNGSKYQAMRKSVVRGEVLDVCRDCLNGNSNYSVVPKLEPSLLLKEIRSMFHRALL